MTTGTMPPDRRREFRARSSAVTGYRAAEKIAVPVIDVRLDGPIPNIFGDYARQRIGRVAERSPSPITAIRIRLAARHESAVVNPFVAQVDIAASRPVRVQVTGASAPSVVDSLRARVWTRLRTLSAGNAIEGERCPSQAEPLLYLRPVRQRTVTRTKFFCLKTRTPPQIALDMALMDYTFELFRETGAATDSVLYRTSHGDYRLTRLDLRPHSVITGDLPISIDDAPVPELDRAEALSRLSLSAAPFLFYRDRALERGCVLYHRYDGHYGLMTSRR
ncbi:sigma 54 modulation/S30EA ribosomal C-terminal domain-containing protein [Nocardia vaccinii]|uniref:sigma 54 modulation/S30EA ribosomal C-terminal domain-containing protein n=1 Tax=Nocardia vaccinii TaxID=1822 RepID=UPI000830D7B0|nr:sigma 54 modulation/S30EA ribosomal C-terminal domain-containing protein [Nocardia vaccinii]